MYIEKKAVHILASDFFEKDDRYIFKARNLCCVGNFFDFGYVFIVFF